MRTPSEHAEGRLETASEADTMQCKALGVEKPTAKMSDSESHSVNCDAIAQIELQQSACLLYIDCYYTVYIDYNSIRIKRVASN